MGKNGAQTLSIYSGDFAFLMGYRPWERHLFSIFPSFGFSSISGAASTISSAVPIGFHLGYEYRVEVLYTRLEAAYRLGSAGSAKLKGITFGALFGYDF